MLCTGCRTANRPPNGTPLRGYCDACGWALREVVETIPRPLPGVDPIRRVTYSPDLVTVAPPAAMCVALGEIAKEKGQPVGLAAEDRTDALRRALVPVIESRR